MIPKKVGTAGDGVFEIRKIYASGKENKQALD